MAFRFRAPVALAGGWFLKCAADGKEMRGIAGVLVCGLALFAAGLVLARLKWIPHTNFWLNSPEWVMMRLGIVFALFSLFWRLEARGFAGAAPVMLVGMESLFAYVFHLIGIYWITGEKALVPLLSHREYGMGTAFVLYAVLLCATFSMTYLWTRTWRHRRSR